SVFYNRGNNKKSHIRVDTLEEKLHRARQHRFLFLPSQQINKPIQHLKYHKRLVLRDEKYYKFPIPPDSIETKTAIDILTIPDPPLRLCPGNELTSTSNTRSPATTSQPILLKDENTWHDKQAKIKGQQHTPGNIWWLKGIRKRKEAHEQAVRLQKNRDAAEAARLSLEEELSARAKLWGTSSNHIEHREDTIKNLTYFQDHFHKKITTFTDRRAELGLFSIDYSSVMDDYAPLHHYPGHTSDDTKQLEIRPHKRLPILTTNTDRQWLADSYSLHHF
ncbi:hypothetical protein RhiirC2_792275, partial [Rhizophagus irregularis]